MTASEPPVALLKAELFKALAHPVRVRALEQLLQGERSVGELAGAIEVEISHLSQQLGILRRADIVTTRREGNTVFYGIRDDRLKKIFATAREMLVSRLEDSHSLLSSLATESGDAGRGSSR